MTAIICTLAFGNISVLSRTFEMVKATVTQNLPWYVLNQHYPLPSKESFQNGLAELQKKYGFLLFDKGSNLGLHNGINYLLEFLQDDDILIGLDPDTLPATPGWDAAMVKLFNDPTVVWASLANEHSFHEMQERGFISHMIQGLKVRIPLAPVINSICAWRVSWLRGLGGISEPTKYYGGLEMSMWKHVNQETKRWVFLQHFWEHKSADFPSLEDFIYKKYKWAHAHEGDQRSFDEYLQAQ